MNLYYLRKRVGHAVKRWLGKKYVPARYAQMYHDLSALAPATVLEIGTNDGLNAARMMAIAAAKSPGAQYYGFDLFEDLDNSARRREFALRVPSKAQVAEYLRAQGVRNATLLGGDTRVSLKQAELPPMDFIFIDGGHSEETVASDWLHCQRLMHDRTVVYFDDYPNWGIGPVVDTIDRRRFEVSITGEYDEFPDSFSDSDKPLKFQLARVTRR